MELLVLVLNQQEQLDKILEGFLNIGIGGATVLDSTGMGRTLCDKVPIFGGIRQMLQGCRPNNITVFTVITEEEKKKRAVNLLENVLGDMTKPNTGIYFTIPVTSAGGLVETSP